MNELSTAATVPFSVSVSPTEEAEEKTIERGEKPSEKAPDLREASTPTLPGSTFEQGTIEINLQFLPHDGHVEGRRIRNALVVNGKTLRVGSLRVNVLAALLTSLAGQSPDHVLERLATYVMECQQQVGAVQQLLAQKTTKQPIAPARSLPPPAQPSLLDAVAPLEQSISQRSLLHAQESHSGSSRPQTRELASDAEAPVQQLTLFS